MRACETVCLDDGAHFRAAEVEGAAAAQGRAAGAHILHDLVQQHQRPPLYIRAARRPRLRSRPTSSTFGAPLPTSTALSSGASETATATAKVSPNSPSSSTASRGGRPLVGARLAIGAGSWPHPASRGLAHATLDAELRAGVGSCMLPDTDLPRARRAYFKQRSRARERRIAFTFDFDTWLEWWLVDSRWARRGRGGDKLCMARPVIQRTNHRAVSPRPT